MSRKYVAIVIQVRFFRIPMSVNSFVCEISTNKDLHVRFLFVFCHFLKQQVQISKVRRRPSLSPPFSKIDGVLGIIVRAAVVHAAEVNTRGGTTNAN